ncbi:MAG: L-rhamnose/proton symporter RhaT [Nibricoccus sp.]
MPPLVLSISFHAIGAFCAAICYAPQKRVTGWSWQTFWLIQAAFCWFLLPVIGAFLTVPDYLSVVRAVPNDVMLRTFLLGALYGVGGTAFGMAIRYVGFSVTYAIAIGVSMIGGTVYAIAKGDTSIADTAAHVQEFFAKTGSLWVTGGMAVALIGIALCGVAGKFKELDHAKSGAAQPGENKTFLGLILCLVAGVLSAVYGMSLAEGTPLAKAAAAQAAGQQLLGIDAATFSSNAIYPFSNTGAFLTTALYCLWLHRRQKTFGEIVGSSPKGGIRLPLNWILAFLTGCLWYGQFFFYGFGHFYIEKVKGFEQTCWAIHMILLILLGTLVGIVFKEWSRCQKRTYVTLALSLALLIAGKLALDYGNYLGQQTSEAAAQTASAK